MFSKLPQMTDEFLDWTWVEIEPYYLDLASRVLNGASVTGWLMDWSDISRCMREIFQRLYVGVTVDTTDKAARQNYERYLDGIFPKLQVMEQQLKEKFLQSGLTPPGMEVPLRNLRAEAAFYREANNPLLSEELKLGTEYDAIIGAQSVMWDGQEVTLTQLDPIYQQPDRVMREKAWRLVSQRQLADRQAINDLWGRFMKVRGTLAINANLDNYRSYRWQQLLRLDYTPVDCQRFHAAIQAVAVPAASRIYEKKRVTLGLDSLRPWDLVVNIHHYPPLHPFTKIADLESKTAAIFTHVDPELGGYFQLMRQEKLLDLDNRKGKAPGGYCTSFPFSRRPFIFMNSVGVHDDVQTLLHEGGHAFHVFETASLPYIHQLDIGLEFDEVASMAMEFLAAPYLTSDFGGFYSRQEAARARIDHLEAAICFWPYMAVVDKFQHWVYENHTLGSDPENCDRKWRELWDEFMLGVDWSNLEAAKETGWQRKLHIHQVPFYYVEYGLAQLGAAQVWRNALKDQAGAVKDYRKALRLGGTVATPQLYAAAGARFAFDEETLGQAVGLMENTISELEKTLN